MDYCNMSISSCIPVTWLFPVLRLIFPLLDMWAIDMRCVELSATWIQATGATSRIPHLLFPVSRYRVSCYQQSSCPIIVLHVSCTVLVPDTLCTLNVWNIRWGWGRLDGWLDLVGWMFGSIVCPTAGDGVVLATICYSRAPVSRYVLAHWDPVTCYSLSGLALVSAARDLFKAVVPGMHGIHPPD